MKQLSAAMLALALAACASGPLPDIQPHPVAAAGGPVQSAGGTVTAGDTSAFYSASQTSGPGADGPDGAK
jgi:hypothetical protein